jgi:uncharacterized protein YdhG (YjbR/CyaY superfamily)
MRTTVAQYLSEVPETDRAALEHIRQLIHTLVPTATEVMSYRIPGFKYKNAYLAGYAVFKDHLSFFPTSEPIEMLRHKLTPYKLSKGTIQFSAAQPLPDDLIRELVQIRLHAIEAAA